MNNTLKNFGITIGIIAIIVGGLFLYSKYYLTNDQVGLDAQNLNPNFPGKDIKEKLDSINALRLEAGVVLFSDVAYKSLNDGTVNLGSESLGRPNPFAPVYRNVTVPATTAKKRQP